MGTASLNSEKLEPQVEADMTDLPELLKEIYADVKPPSMFEGPRRQGVYAWFLNSNSRHAEFNPGTRGLICLGLSQNPNDTKRLNHYAFDQEGEKRLTAWMFDNPTVGQQFVTTKFSTNPS
jgi:hypothetical protein